MNTVILVLLCLAIAGRELYLASDKRLPRAQAELRELRAQLAELARRHDALQVDVAEAAAPSGIPIPQPDPPDVLDRVDAFHDRVERLEKTTGDLADELAGLDADRDAQRALARSLDTVERDVRELQREMLDRLDREEGVVDGLLLSEEGEAEALLADAYEDCASEYGLRVRVRDPRPDGGWLGTAYRLSGMRADALAEELFSYTRGLYAPDDPSALGALLTELAQLRGGGVARFGPFTAVRTQSTLLCGLLPDDEAAAEPWELAGRIRELPDDRRCDLSWLRTDD
ncbi:hypothetical protein [Actinomadura algeriensis]|uniref:Septal ring factor EnvC (AmiA/AmiB activator) n=1 Tax=Actinomadura algeriensis TaxID=1679523 RepID=A0ABR9JTF4_9ACTN|nr:hypothetical protein [Actinomadura algeriensis]MBE1533854.1 septal ring factor EnvC (AmiA/AmiB activator) [Actinomadura algeriensis]